MRAGILQDAEKKRHGASMIRRKRRREGESGIVWTLGQDLRNVARQVRTHRTHGTQNIWSLRQDATPADQTQDPFLLMFPTTWYPGLAPSSLRGPATCCSKDSAKLSLLSKWALHKARRYCLYYSSYMWRLYTCRSQKACPYHT